LSPQLHDYYAYNAAWVLLCFLLCIAPWGCPRAPCRR